MLVDDEAHTCAHRLYFLTQRVILRTSDHDRIDHASLEKRCSDSAHEARSTWGDREERLWLTHTCRTACGEDDSGDHAPYFPTPSPSNRPKGGEFWQTPKLRFPLTSTVELPTLPPVSSS